MPTSAISHLGIAPKCLIALSFLSLVVLPAHVSGFVASRCAGLGRLAWHNGIGRGSSVCSPAVALQVNLHQKSHTQLHSIRASCSDQFNAPKANELDLQIIETSATRRQALALFTGAIVQLSQPMAPWANAETDAVRKEPEITAKVFLELSISGRSKALENEKWEKIIARDKRAGNITGDQTGRLVIGLYGKEAPESVQTFLSLIKGSLVAPCMDEEDAAPEDFGMSEKTRLTKRQILRQCKAAEDKPIGYRYSQAWRIIKDRRIDLGRMNRVFRQAPRNEDANGLTHDAAGVVSVRRGGGEFEFAVAPAASAELDATNIVIGRVLEGLELVAQLNEAPVSQGQFLEGAFKFTGNLIGDSRAGLNTQYKPLQKIVVKACGLVQ